MLTTIADGFLVSGAGGNAVVLGVLILAIITQTLVGFFSSRRIDKAFNVIQAYNAIARESTDSQLRQIHTLVNSDMTAARQGELQQTLITLRVLRKFIAQEREAGRDVSGDEAVVDETETRVEELRRLLADRLHQQELVEQEQAHAREVVDFDRDRRDGANHE